MSRNIFSSIEIHFNTNTQINFMEVKTLFLASILVAFVGAALASPGISATTDITNACPAYVCILYQADEDLNEPESLKVGFCNSYANGCEYCCQYCSNNYPDALIVGDPCCECTVAQGRNPNCMVK
jgi:hypothetical protein